MAKYELKTQKNAASVDDFIQKVEDEQKKKDCLQLLKLMKKISGQEPKMWGSSIVGFGEYTYKGKSGATGQWIVTGFSPRKQNLSIMLMAGLHQNPDLLEKLGKYKTGVSCLYVKKLSDIDMGVLEKLVEKSVEGMKNYDFMRNDEL